MSGRKDIGTMHTWNRRSRPGMLSLAASTAVVAAAVLGGPPAHAAAVAASPRMAPAAAALPAAAPAAITSPHGCSSATGTDRTCDLFARSSTQTLAGVAVPMWTFTSSAADTPTATGPVIVANQGDTLHLVLHNQVTCPSTTATDCSLSLAVPGMKGSLSDTTGIVNDGTTTKAYTFTADRPGTFLYEAGHTAVGPRAVAMGLVGAIVVRPSSGAGSDIGPGTEFNDEAVMVLTDVDPKLAAAPLTFDLRNFHSTYRLVNGVAYSPSAPKISTTAGAKVLLRYLNAGMISHSMGVLNQRQTVVAIDAYADSSGGLVADTLPPGETEDVLVTAPEGETPVYDTSGALDNGGGLVAGDGTTSGLKRVAFGGMMQMLSTAPVTTNGDTVGPKTTISAASATSVTANFVDQVSPLCVSACTASPVTAAEYFVDNIPGAGGSGTPVTITTPATSTTQTFPVTVSGAGQHHVYVRAQDSQGNWGLPTSALVTVVAAGPSTTGVALAPAAASVPAGKAAVTITATGDASAVSDTVAAMEFFVQSPSAAAPDANTRGTAMTINGSGAVVPGSGTYTATAEGTYSVLVRSQGATSGVWGGFSTATLTVDNTAPAAAAVTNSVVSPGTTDGKTGSAIDSTALSVQATFSDTGTVTTPIVAAEGYLPTPAAGTTTQTAPTSAQNGTGFVFQANDGTFDGHTATSGNSEAAYGLIPLSQLTAFPDGSYNVWVHGRDTAGNWGAWVPVPFTVKRAPVVTGVSATQNSARSYTLTITGTSAAAVTAASWSADGGTTWTTCTATGTAGPGAVSVSCPVTLTSDPTGDLTLQARVTSSKGTSAPGSVTILNSLPGLAGPVPVQNPASSSTVAIPAPAAATYYGKGTFTPGTLVTGTNWVTVAALRNGPATAVAVQYRKGSTGSGSIRLQVNGVTATPVATVTPSTVTLRIRRAAGLAVQLQVIQGSTTVVINGGTVANGSTVTSTVLGNLGGGSVSGSGSLSGLAANRFTAPA